jgi:hypothetical protein
MVAAGVEMRTLLVLADAMERSMSDLAARTERCPAIILIASGGSSGSHLLNEMLSHYEPFFLAPEANLASQPELFDDVTFHGALLSGVFRPKPVVPPEAITNGKKFLLVPSRVLTRHSPDRQPVYLRFGGTIALAAPFEQHQEAPRGRFPA